MAESIVLTQVKDIVSRTLKIPLEQLDADADFDSFGIDSIIAMELMSNLSKEMNISITPAQFTEVNTIKELASSIEQITEGDGGTEVEDQPVQPPVVEETTPQPAYTQAEQAPQLVRNTSYQRTTLRRSTATPYQNVLDKIQQEFSIDLSYRKFRSLEEIADTLVTSHLDELLMHYNITDEKIDVQPYPDTAAVQQKTTGTTPAANLGDIAIVGISCNFPDAPDAKTYWNNLIEKKNSFKEIPLSRWDWKEFYSETVKPGKTDSKWAALIEHHDCFDAKFFKMEDDEVLLIDPQERLLLQEVYKSFQDGGINPAELKGSNTGVYVSYEYSEYEHYLRNNIDRLELGENKPFFSSSSPTYFLANRLSFMYDFHGPSESFNVNCAGSAVAINRAYHSLLTGENDVAVVGGVSLNLFADDYIALSKYGMLSPNGTCGVFDDDANGFTRGEGVASVILKRLTDAERDNNKIYGVIKSSSQNNRGKARFIQEIDTESITDVISKCYEKIGIDPETVSYIEVDGYATKWGDSFEYEGIKKVFKKSKSKEKTCALGSLKGNIGNLESVNGLAGLIKLAMSMDHKKFPATISKKKTNAFIDIDNPNNPLYIADSEISFDTIRKQPGTPIRAGINAFADTGVNVHILIEEYNDKHRDSNLENTSEPQLFVLSAKDKNRLMESVLDYINYVSGADESVFLNAIYTLQMGREAMEERLAIVASSFDELNKKLNVVKKGLDQKKPVLEKQGIFLGSASKSDDNPLNGIFTDDMGRMLIYQTQQSDRWEKLAKLWISGFDVPWELIWENKAAQPISLPFYPFYKERYWPEVSGDDNPTIVLNGKEQQDSEIAKVPENEVVENAEWYFYLSEGKADEENGFNGAQKIELFLQQQIALLLKCKVQEVDLSKNFLDLGLNSIDIGTFVSNTMSLLHITMSPAIIFNNPDIKSLSGYLFDTYPDKIAALSVTTDEAKAQSQNEKLKTVSSQEDGLADVDKVIVPLQTKGKKKPVFAVSQGGNGTTLSFQHLVQALGKGQPFYGLEFVMSDKIKPEEITINSIAQTNVEAIQKVQPKGPYQLLAYSNGGMIAFEMAKILLEKGEKIEYLSFLDCFSPLQPVIDMVDEIVAAFRGKFDQSTDENLDLDVEKLKSIPESERMDYLYEAVSKNGFAIPKEQFETTYNVLITLDHSCREYKPSKLESSINTVLFRATKGYMEGYEDLPADYEWNKLLPDEIEICDIDADHFSITEKEPSTIIAKKLNSLADKKPKRRKRKV